jgi:tRNA-specific 2-thiouridylase
MRVYDGSIAFPEGTGNGCYGPGEEEDEAACARLCEKLGAEYRVIDLAAAYSKEVLGYFKAEYRSGRTPNPCLRCNPILKFGMLPAALRESGIPFDYYATGHYARLFAPGGDSENGVYLAPAVDFTKDQSYFLHRVSAEALKSARFPLGELTKKRVRELARERGLEVAEKPDSQDFIAAEDYGPLFSDAPVPEGDIVDERGRAIGKHRGIVRYTVGQRRGLGVSAGPDPLYVLSVDARANKVVVGPEKGLFAEALEASDAVWARGFGSAPFRALVKIRLASKPAPALVTPLPGGRVRVDFDAPQRAVAPGQSVAYYVRAAESPAPAAGGAGGPLDGCVVAGGAVIDGSAEKTGAVL